jgi:hypothetical protein
MEFNFFLTLVAVFVGIFLFLTCVSCCVFGAEITFKCLGVLDGVTIGVLLVVAITLVFGDIAGLVAGICVFLLLLCCSCCVFGTENTFKCLLYIGGGALCVPVGAAVVAGGVALCVIGAGAVVAVAVVAGAIALGLFTLGLPFLGCYKCW